MSSKPISVLIVRKKVHFLAAPNVDAFVELFIGFRFLCHSEVLSRSEREVSYNQRKSDPKVQQTRLTQSSPSTDLYGFKTTRIPQEGSRNK